ncbi:BQ2448_4902 [Microbotryum intermedium]|uniref:BQ2448_4902 protein n=1 Tax=Microbotryum intermedium TaxID=269621 RepID=A0A238FLY9_9BASI|nr:BQ2448_4902 [Microbotryum intermedium]
MSGNSNPFSRSAGPDGTSTSAADTLPYQYPWTYRIGVADLTPSSSAVPSGSAPPTPAATNSPQVLPATPTSPGLSQPPRFGVGFPALGAAPPTTAPTAPISIPNQTRPRSITHVGPPQAGASTPPNVSSRSSPRPTDRRLSSSFLGGFTARPSSHAAGYGATSSQRQSVVQGVQTGTTGGSMPRTYIQSQLSKGNYIANYLSEVQDAVNEWTFFGVEFTITDVAALAEATTVAIDESASSSAKNRQEGIGGSNGLEVFGANFGGDRWRLELLRQQGINSASGLALYLSCHLLETSYSPDVIPTQLMLGIREPRQQASKRGGSEGYFWRHWVDEFRFSHDNEYYEMHEFPSLQSLLEKNTRIRKLDAFVLSVQIGSPVGSFAPQVRDAHPVPKALLSGVRNLVDDEATGDVMIHVAECRPTSGGTGCINDTDSFTTPAPDSPGSSAPSPEFRKRVIYAHSAILKAQNSYFDSLLSEGWAETSVTQAPGTRRRSVLKIEDFDFNTVHSLLHYLYTDEISFQDIEDMRSRQSAELPLGWLGPRPERLQWSWFTVEEAEGWIESGHEFTSETPPREDRPLSDIPETESLGSRKTASPLPSKPQAKPRLAHGISPVCPKPPPVNTVSEEAEAAQSPTRAISAAGRISPLFGPPSRASTSGARPCTSRRSIDVSSQSATAESTSGASRVIEPLDPHLHPIGPQEPASALSMYRIAHRYCHPALQKLALEQIVNTLTARTAFPMLLSNYLWPEVYEAVKSFTLEHFEAVSADPEFDRCYTEVGEGLWEHGGAVLLDLTRSLTPAQSRWS